MAFKFVHTADWQIGKPFGRFPIEIAAQLRAERWTVIDRLAAAGRAGGASHVLVAGDVFDSEHLDDQLIWQTLGRLGLHSDLVWHLLPGNHDPSRAGGVWERVTRFGLPVNVALRLQASPALIEPNVAVLPAPLTSKQQSDDPTGWMDSAATAEGCTRIGLAHGSIQGFGSLGEAAVKIDASRRMKAGLSYLALGDWHGCKEVEPATWYSGTPEPDSFLENDAGHALVVTVDGAAAAARITRVSTGHFIWRDLRVRMHRLADVKPAAEILGRAGSDQPRMIVSLALEGALTASEVLQLEDELTILRSRLFRLEVDRRSLGTTIQQSDIDHLGDPALSAIAGRLQERAASEDRVEAQRASRAMSLMLSMAADFDRRQQREASPS